MEIGLTDQLLLSQIVCHSGSTDWDSIASQLSSSPFFKHSTPLSPAESKLSYLTLLAPLGYSLDKTSHPNSRTARKLAWTIYQQIIQRIVQGFNKNAKVNKDLKRELEEITSGTWDDKLLTEGGFDLSEFEPDEVEEEEEESQRRKEEERVPPTPLPGVKDVVEKPSSKDAPKTAQELEVEARMAQELKKQNEALQALEMDLAMDWDGDGDGDVTMESEMEVPLNDVVEEEEPELVEPSPEIVPETEDEEKPTESFDAEMREYESSTPHHHLRNNHQQVPDSEPPEEKPQISPTRDHQDGDLEPDEEEENDTATPKVDPTEPVATRSGKRRRQVEDEGGREGYETEEDRDKGHVEDDGEENEDNDRESSMAVSPAPPTPSASSAPSNSKKGSKKGKKPPPKRDRKSASRPRSEAGDPSSPAVSVAASVEGSTRSRRHKTEEEAEEEPLVSAKEAKAVAARFKKSTLQLLEQLQSHSDAHHFIEKIPRSIAPAYAEAVLRPMCIKDVVRRVKDATITETNQVMRDVALIFANAVQFNGTEVDIANKAKIVWAHFEELMQVRMSSEYVAT